MPPRRKYHFQQETCHFRARGSWDQRSVCKTYFVQSRKTANTQSTISKAKKTSLRIHEHREDDDNGYRAWKPQNVQWLLPIHFLNLCISWVFDTTRPYQIHFSGLSLVKPPQKGTAEDGVCDFYSVDFSFADESTSTIICCDYMKSA